MSAKCTIYKDEDISLRERERKEKAAGILIKRWKRSHIMNIKPHKDKIDFSFLLYIFIYIYIYIHTHTHMLFKRTV